MAIRSVYSLSLPLAGVLLVGLVGAPLAADGEGPLGNVIRDARAADTLKGLVGTTYYEGGNRGGTAVVEHTFRVTEKGLESIFVEHLRSGGSKTATYRLGPNGRLESIAVKGLGLTMRAAREGKELVIEAKPEALRVPLPGNAAPMSIMMFVLPRLVNHLPEVLELAPVFGKRVLPSKFALRRREAEGDELLIELTLPDKSSMMKIFVSGAKATHGQILRFESQGEVIRPLSAKEAKGQIAALNRKLGGEGKAAGFSTPKAAVEGLIAACKAGDLKAAGACFSAKAPGEFQSLRDGSASPKTFKQLCELFAGATVGEASVKGDRAEVPVALKSRKERLTLVKEGSGWLILDF